MKYDYKTNWGAVGVLDTDAIIKMMRNSEKIPLIKEIRGISNLSLKESKELIEKYQIPNPISDAYQPHKYDEKGLLDEFLSRANIHPDPFTKEEFMHTLENAIDNMNVFAFKDMLTAVHALCHNIEEKGGLEALAKERDNFLNNI